MSHEHRTECVCENCGDCFPVSQVRDEADVCEVCQTRMRGDAACDMTLFLEHNDEVDTNMLEVGAACMV